MCTHEPWTQNQLTLIQTLHMDGWDNKHYTVNAVSDSKQAGKVLNIL